MKDAGQMIQGALAPLRARYDSWTQLPFVDVTVVDAQEFPNGCPNTHPEELIFEVWPGTMGVCDRLRN